MGEPNIYTQTDFNTKQTLMRPLFLTLLFVCFHCYGYGQGNPNKSQFATSQNFSQVMGVTQPTQAQFDTLLMVAQSYCYENKDTCTLMTDYILQVTTDQPQSENRAQALMLDADRYRQFGDPTLAVESLKSAKKIFVSQSDSLMIAKVDARIGSVLFGSGKFEIAIDHLIAAVKMYKAKRDSSYYGSLMNIAGVYFYLGDLSKATEYLSEAIELAEDKEDTKGMVHAMVNKTQLYIQWAKNNQDRADTSQNQADKLLFQDSSVFLLNEGLDVILKANDSAKSVSDKVLELMTLPVIVDIKTKLNRIEEAIMVGNESVLLADQIGIPMFRIRTKLTTAKAHIELKSYQAAENYLISALEIAEKIKSTQDKLVINEQLYELYTKIGDFKDANEKLNLILLHEQNENREKLQIAVADAETKYLTAEKENQLLQKEKDILQLQMKEEKVTQQRNYIVGCGLSFVLLGFLGVRMNQIQKDRNARKRFAGALITAQEEERKRIARDLHDGVGQSLLLLSKKLQKVEDRSEANEQMAQQALEEVRSISRDLHPIHLEKFGLTSAIENLLEKVERSTGLFISHEIDNIDQAVSTDSEIHLFRTIQEAISNIVKHAEATAVNLLIKKTNEKIQVTIKDNGKGFDVENKEKISNSLGLRTMQERIAVIKGEIQFKRGENKGMVVEINIPNK